MLVNVSRTRLHAKILIAGCFIQELLCYHTCMSEQQKTQGGEKKRRPWYFRKKNVVVVEPKKPKGNYAFIDSQNLNLGVQKAGWKMDWHKFRLWLTEKHGVTQAFMFIGYMVENESLYQQMYDHGFLVVLKPTLDIKQIPNDKPAHQMTAAEKAKKDERPAVKGNVDADLVLYAMKEIPNYDKAVIVSGDGDFFGLIEYLAANKKLHKLITPNRQYSTLFSGFEEYVENLDSKRSELSYRSIRRQPKQRGR